MPVGTHYEQVSPTASNSLNNELLRVSSRELGTNIKPCCSERSGSGFNGLCGAAIGPRHHNQMDRQTFEKVRAAQHFYAAAIHAAAIEGKHSSTWLSEMIRYEEHRLAHRPHYPFHIAPQLALIQDRGATASSKDDQLDSNLQLGQCVFEGTNPLSYVNPGRTSDTSALAQPIEESTSFRSLLAADGFVLIRQGLQQVFLRVRPDRPGVVLP